MNMHRKIALEIWHRRRFPDVRIGYMPPSDLEMKALLDDADGALDALMDPTQEMIAAIASVDPYISTNDARERIQNMIRATKEEPQQ